MNSGIYKIELASTRELLRGKRACEYFSALKARTTYSEVCGGMWVSIHEYGYTRTYLGRISDVDLARFPTLCGVSQVAGSNQRKGASAR